MPPVYWAHTPKCLWEASVMDILGNTVDRQASARRWSGSRTYMSDVNIEHMRSVLNGVLWQYLSVPVRLFLSTSVGASSLFWWVTYLALFLRISAGDSSLVLESPFSCGSPDIVSWSPVDGLESRFNCGSPDIVSWSFVDGLESRFSCGSPDIVSWSPVDGLESRFNCGSPDIVSWSLVDGLESRFSCGSPDIVSWSPVDGLESRFSCGPTNIISWWPIVGLRGRPILLLLLLFFCTGNLTPVWEIVLGCRYKYITLVIESHESRRHPYCYTLEYLRHSNKDVCGSRVIELLKFRAISH